MEWKWSNGDVYYRSTRPRPQQRLEEPSANSPFFDNNNNNNNAALFQRSTGREDLDEKLADRAMMAQTGTNPFIQSNYVHDVVMRDQFLKPVLTTFERTKTSSEK